MNQKLSKVVVKLANVKNVASLLTIAEKFNATQITNYESSDLKPVFEFSVKAKDADGFADSISKEIAESLVTKKS
jgi:hypothetical protein